MKSSAMAVRAFVWTSAMFLAHGVEAQPAPPAQAAKPAPKPVVAVTTTFDAVHDGAFVAGRAVDFPVILLPETAIQNKSAGKTTYYVLAVRKDGPYFKAAETLLAELKGPGGEMMREIPTAIADDKRYKQLIGGLTDLLKRAHDAPHPEETVAVEIPGFQAVASAYDWETVRPPYMTLFDPIAPYRGDLFSIDAVGVRREILNMAMARPPNVEQSLPQMNMSPLFQFKDQADRDNFNAAVDLFNAELHRRRAYVVEGTEADVQLTLDRLESRLGQKEETLYGIVIPPPSLAKETFSNIYKDKTPPVFVRERGKPEASLARRALATTTVQICSYPTGASVRLDGREVGVTPYIARSFPAASKLKIVVAKEGLPPQEAVETVPMKASGAKRFEYNLVTTKPRLLSVEEARRLFDPAFKPGQPFTLAILSPAVTPLAPPKKETKEQKKERAARDQEGRRLTEYVDSMRKATSAPGGAAASWFRLVDGREADVTIEIVAIQPSERRGKFDSTSTYRASVRFAGDAPGGGSSEDITPWIAKAERPLELAMGRLKNERWQRLLGVE